MEVIDFHAHPMYDFHLPTHGVDIDLPRFRDDLLSNGITRVCGSVIYRAMNGRPREEYEEIIPRLNDQALACRDVLGDFYIPGFHVHPDFIEESIREIERMHREGVRLVGELVPYSSGWSENAAEGLSALFDDAEKYNMLVSFHTDETYMTDEMIRRHKNLTFVAAHPGEAPSLMRHIERAKISKNYYLDLSGTGLFRYGMLARAVKEMGADHVLFGTDYPICTPAMYIGGVAQDPYLTDEEKALIFAGNAKRLLGL